jgi:hypothetical protein
MKGITYLNLQTVLLEVRLLPAVIEGCLLPAVIEVSVTSNH